MTSSNSKRFGLLLILWQLFVGVACERYEQISVPEEKADFIGRWSAGSNFFELEENGDVNLEIEGPTESLLVRKGSLRSLEGESICVGVGKRHQGDCLPISATPYTAEGRELIRLGGVELERELEPR